VSPSQQFRHDRSMQMLGLNYIVFDSSNAFIEPSYYMDNIRKSNI